MAALVALVLVVVATGILFLKLRYGLLWGDEGFYLATSRALLVGGVPFRDDLSHAATWFFVVLTPLMALLPDGGALLHAREAGLLLRFLAAVLLFLSFRRQLPPLLLGAGVSATLLANFPYLLVPSYNNLPFDASCAGVAAWYAGAAAPGRGRALAWGAVSGALFVLAALCHLPRATLLALPLLVLLWSLRRPAPALPGLRASSAACLTASIGLAALALGVVTGSGLLADLLAGLRTLAGSRAFGATPAGRLARLLGRDLPRVLATAGLHGVFWGGALVLAARAAGARARRRRALVAGLGVLLAAYALLLTGLYVRSERWFTAYYLIYPGLCWLPLCAYPWLRDTLRGALGATASGGAALVFVTLLSQQVLVALVSTQGAAAGASGVGASLLLLALMSVSVATRLGDQRPPDGPPAAPALGAAGRWGAGAAAALLLTLAGTASVFHFCPEESPLRAALVPFRTGRLAGLHTTERRVAGWTELVTYLATRLAPGERVLAYSNVPLVYYATDSRPALGATVVSSLLFAPGEQRALVERMQARGHVPRYAVRLREGTLDEDVHYSDRPLVDPVNAFVRRNYRLEARLLLFDVFRQD